MAEERRGRKTRRADRQSERSSARPAWPWIVAGVIAVAVIAYFAGLRPYPAGPTATDAASTGPHSADDPRITLIAGSSAPDFSLPAVDGTTVKLSEQRAKGNVLLYFQEGIMCPPCWQQMRDLKRDADKLAALNVSLATITVDPLDDLKANVSREQVQGMTLLADSDLKVSTVYQALYTGMMGGHAPGHSFVLIGRDGTILWRRDFREMYVPDSTILDPVAKALGQ